VAGSVAAALAALDDLAPATLHIGSAPDKPFAFNRRFWMKDGGVTTNPGKLNPEIVEPEGPVDREIGVLAVKRSGEFAGLLVNIVNHTDTIGGDRVSADWPGFLERGVRERLGPDVSVITLIGAAGNINHFDVSDPEPQTSYDEARRIGVGYADIVLGMLPGLQPLGAADVRASHLDVPLRRRRIPEREISAAKAELAAGEHGLAPGRALTSEDLARGDASVKRMFARELLRFAETEAGGAGGAGGAGAEVEYRMRCLTLGYRLAVISLPGEPFTEIGLSIKELSPYDATFVVSHANGSHGYIPLRECFEQGGYEVLPKTGAGLAEETADVLVEYAARALGSRQHPA